MPRDHYVSQVYLANFCDPNGLLHGTRKQDQKTVSNLPRAFCQVQNGNTNTFLSEPRGIEDFLKRIEPRYNRSVEKFRSEEIDPEALTVVAGFIAYLMWCTPAGLRINNGPLTEIMRETARRLDRQGKLPPPPPEFGLKNATEMLDSGFAKIDVNPRYPQAVGLTMLNQQIVTLGNFRWDVLANPFPENPFFTSDYPVAIEVDDRSSLIDKIVPLTTDLAVRIRPRTDVPKSPRDFAMFAYRRRTLERQEVLEINRLVVRCAESFVFYPKAFPWTSAFIRANSDFRIQPYTETIPHGKGTVLFSSTRIAPHTWS